MTERLPDNVMLDDFERLLQIGETLMQPEVNGDAAILELCRFIDANGRRLLLLARVCEQAFARQTKVPSS